MNDLESVDLAPEDAAPLAVQAVVTDAGTWVKKLQLTVAAAEVNKAFDAAAGELAGSIRLPGFRPGKVPRGYLEKVLGADLKRQVTGDLVGRAFHSAIKAEKLEVVGTPEIDVGTIHAERGQDLAFEVNVEIKPTFELGTYKGLAVEQEEIDVFPEEIEEHLEKIRLRFAEEADAPEGAALEERDAAVGPLRYVVEGKELLVEKEAQLLLLDGHVLGSFAHLGLDFLKGAKAGEKRTTEAALTARFPVPEGQNKNATLEFEVQKIRRPNLPALDDALAQRIGIKDFATLKEKIAETIRAQISEETQSKTRQELIGRVVEASPFEVPKRLLGSFGHNLELEQKAMLSQMGLDPEDLAKMGLQEKIAGDAEKKVREYFVLDALCKREQINVEDEEVDEEVVKLARARGVRAGELLQKLEEEGTLDQIKTGLKVKKAVAFLTEHAEIKVVPRKKKEKAGCGHPEHHH